MAHTAAAPAISPGKGIGILTLGASVHYTLTHLKAHPETYTSIHEVHSPTAPLHEPLIIHLPDNGMRLRFDGPDQRLRLIEVLDFSKVPLTYKGYEVKGVKAPGQSQTQGPSFRHVYNKLFGPTYCGEYFPPSDGSSHGTYILSYPGVAFSFPLQHSAWSDQRDFVELMSSSAALPAKSMAVFYGESWANARPRLFTHKPPFPRYTELAGRSRDCVADEVEEVKIYGAGKIELCRRSSSPFRIQLSETTAQDLVAELGPPSAIYRKSDRRISIHGQVAGDYATQPRNTSLTKPVEPSTLDLLPELNVSDDSDDEYYPTTSVNSSSLTGECFFNYFHHGFDVFISYPSTPSPPFPGSRIEEPATTVSQSHLVVTKLLLHGNVPGSYSFNRHRRSRWSLEIDSARSPLNSETPYSQLSAALNNLFQVPEAPSDQKGMVLNRGWGNSPGSSVDILDGSGEPPDWSAEDDRTPDTMGNTQLFGYEGLVFEVLKNGAVSCLTIY